ncbi:MAG TPA: hypothetical protein VK718_05345 [Ferruginibacter sp.]|jgi:hypothetical protein|nr:hypothetical protein [Ferruginibacter sp.]
MKIPVIIITLFIACIAISSCKKKATVQLNTTDTTANNTDSTTTTSLDTINIITATINGVTDTFNTQVGFTFSIDSSTASPYMVFIFSGYTNNYTSNILGEINFPGVTPTAGIYSEDSTAQMKYAAITYNGFYYQANSSSNPVTVTITSITDTSAKGTFTGNVYLNADSTQTPLSIVNGTFNLLQ